MSSDTNTLLRKALAPLEYIKWAQKYAKVGDRGIAWDHILLRVPLEKKVWAGEVVLRNFDLFEDGDHQVMVCTDSGEYVRFYPVAYHRTILDRLNLNEASMNVELGKVPPEHFNALLRDMGLSLSAYRDMRKETSKYLVDDEEHYVLDFSEQNF